MLVCLLPINSASLQAGNSPAGRGGASFGLAYNIHGCFQADTAHWLYVAQILHKPMYDHITSDIRDRLHWLPIQQRLEYKICLLIFKCIHQMAPVYLTVMSDPVSASASRSHLRSAARGDLVLPRSRTTTYGQRSFSVTGPSPWNSLPLSVRDPGS